MALLGEDIASREAALMNGTIGLGHFTLGHEAEARAYAVRNAALLDQLPYVEELRPAYLFLVAMYVFLEKNADEALRWTTNLAQKAAQHHDTRTLGNVEDQGFAWPANATGDLRGAITHLQRGHDIFTQAGDTKFANGDLFYIGIIYLELGDLQQAEDHASRAFLRTADTDLALAKGWAAETLGTIALAHGALDSAMQYFQQAARLSRAAGPSPANEAWTAVYLGRTALTKGERAAALRHFEVALLQGIPLDFLGAITTRQTRSPTR